MKIAVVTGASSGIGKAIAARLLDEEGMKVYAVSRSGNIPYGCIDMRADLSCWSTLEPLMAAINTHKRLDVLVHAAGMFYSGDAKPFLDLQHCVNADAPRYLTTLFVPQLMSAHGQVVFLNSIAGLRIAHHTAQRTKLASYASTKHALRSFADSFRFEATPKGIRVLSVYLGKVATPMQEVCYREDEQAYHPEILLQPEDVASTIVNCLNLPRTAEVTDLTLRSMNV